MTPKRSFDELTYLFGSAPHLPQIPKSPLRLSELLDSPDAAHTEIEAVVHADPALTASVLKAASSAVFGRSRPVTNVREAIMVLGYRSLRSLAVALWTNALVCESTHRSKLDKERFAKNGNFVGALASGLYRQRLKTCIAQTWTPEDLFAAGVLHEILFGLLSYVAPEEFDLLHDLAQEKSVSLRQTFLMAYSRPIQDLAPRAADALGLPDLFLATAERLDDPLNELETSIPMACLHLARATAEANSMGLPPWPVLYEVPEDVQTVVGATPEDLVDHIDQARKQLILVGIRSA